MKKNFTDIVEQLMQCEKKTLAEMLAMKMMESDTCDSEPLNTKNPFVVEPYYNPYYLPCGLSGNGQCTNPFHDCVNCPHNKVTVWYTTTSISNIE